MPSRGTTLRKIRYRMSVYKKTLRDIQVRLASNDSSVVEKRALERRYASLSKRLVSYGLHNEPEADVSRAESDDSSSSTDTSSTTSSIEEIPDDEITEEGENGDVWDNSFQVHSTILLIHVIPGFKSNITVDKRHAIFMMCLFTSCFFRN